MDSRREKNHGEEWGPSAQKKSSCRCCGVEDEVGNLYHTGSGLSCAFCFSEGEDEITATPPAPAWMLFARGLPFLLLPLPILGQKMAWWDLELHPYVFVVWMIAFACTVVGSPFVWGTIAGFAREDYYRPGLEDHERRRLMIGHGYLALAVLAGLVGTMWMAATSGGF